MWRNDSIDAGLPRPENGASAAQIAGCFAAIAHVADRAHRVSHQIDARLVDGVVAPHPRQDLHDILLAQLDAPAVGRGRIRRQAEPVEAVTAEAERRDDDVATLLRQRRDRPAVPVHERVFVGAEAVQRDDQRVAARTVIPGRHVDPVGHDLAGGGEQVMPLESPGPSGERITPAGRIRGDGLGRRQFRGDVERAQLDDAAVDLADVIARVAQVVADAGRGSRRLRFQSFQTLVDALQERQAQAHRAERPLAVRHAHLENVDAVVEAREVEIHRERRLAQVACDVVEASQRCGRDGGRRGSGRPRRRLRRQRANRRGRGERLRQRDGGSEDLLQAHDVGTRRIDHHRRRTQHQRALELLRVRPRSSGQYRPGPWRTAAARRRCVRWPSPRRVAGRCRRSLL